ncbi:hypothetical protein ACJMK2_012757 [Sinanodonta woodiana]|uniref:Uncharacterized protein n=1 Tax=Sinanodonta woodiana TaxID=1069815 RepID=A0ABD3V9I3_SINWO
MTDYTDILMGVAFLILFLIFATRKYQTWLTADMIFTAIMGICLLIDPGASIKMETTGLKVHALHRFMNRLFASMLLGPLLIWYRCRKTNDETVLGSMLWSRVVGGLPLVILITHGHMTYSFFMEKHFWFGILGNFLWWLVNVVHLWKSRPCMCRQQIQGSLNLILNIWFLIDFVGSLALMAFPGRLLTFQTIHVDKHSMHTCRAVGALLLGTSIFNWYAPSYLSDTDRKTVFISGIATNLLVILSTLVGYCVDGLQSSKEQLLLVVGAVLLRFCPLLFGLYLFKTDITTNTKSTDRRVHHIHSMNKKKASST